MIDQMILLSKALLMGIAFTAPPATKGTGDDENGRANHIRIVATFPVIPHEDALLKDEPEVNPQFSNFPAPSVCSRTPQPRSGNQAGTGVNHRGKMIRETLVRGR